jgi:polyhydroxyalkanoate synthase
MSQANASNDTDLSQVLGDVTDLGKKLVGGARLLSEVRDEDVQIGTTPKDEVWRSDKVILYRYRPLVERRLKEPLLIVFKADSGHIEA